MDGWQLSRRPSPRLRQAHEPDNPRFDLLIRGGIVATPSGIAAADVGVIGGRIAAVGALSGAKAAETFEAKGLHVLPGVIDTQVHFREPGNAHKEDLESGSRAAVLGGVTGVFEMPNTNPPTTTRQALEDKLARAANRMHCDYAFYVGASPGNVGALAELERLPGVSGVKAFLGSSTGTLLLDRGSGHSGRAEVRQSPHGRAFRRRGAAERTQRCCACPAIRAAIRCGAMSEVARLSTERVIRLARQAGRRIHVLHVTTADELPLLAARARRRQRRDHAAASDAGGAGMLRAARHLCADEPADPRGRASRCVVEGRQ